MKFGMSTACFFPKLNCEDAISKMDQMGINDIEIFFSTLSEYEPQFISEVKKRVDDSNTNVLSIHALSLQFEPQLFSSHERSRKDSLKIFESVLEAGARLGAKVYVMHGPAHVKRACELNLNYEYIAERTSPLCDLAQSYGINLSWENVHWCWYAHPEFPLKLQEYLKNEKLFYTLDIKQAAQSGYTPSDFIKNTNGKLVNIHVCDYKKTDQGSIVPVLPFYGDLAAEQLKKALCQAKYNGAVMLEVYSNNYKDYTELLSTYNNVKRLLG